MLVYFLRRIALTVPTFVALMFVTFFAIRLVPGDPVEVRVGEHGISPERLAFFRHQLGLDQPVWRQFLDYAWRLMHGDFGVSLSTQQKVLTEFLTLFPATLELSLFAMLFAVLVGVPAGAVAAVKRGGFLRSGADDRVAVRLFDADLLVGPAADHVRLGPSGLLPVSGRIDLINYYFDQPTGFMTIDALLSDQPGAFLDALAPSCPAGDRARHGAARRDRAHDALLDARGAERKTTCAPRAPRDCRPFAVIGVHALRNALLPVVTVDRPLGFEPDRRRGAHGDDLLLAGGRPLADRFDRPARLSRRCRAASCWSR